MSHVRSDQLALRPDSARRSSLVDAEKWELADGILFSVLSSLVLWSVMLTGLYHALN